jgi:phosphopantothenoylcysteine synthetase/decarboxylase
MNVLVTAGNTLAMIDRVRCITNVFTGRTGATIALEAHARGHRVTLLTSHPDALGRETPAGLNLLRYQTFEDLRDRMAELIPSGDFDAVVHCAAVSDYLSAGVYGPDHATRFDAGKIKSDEPELWLRLVRAPKLVDRIRTDWGFRGVLVKFKLEVGLGDDELLAVAERSRLHSGADLMVANTLEGSAACAFLGAGEYQRVARRALPASLLDAIEGRLVR